MLGEDEIMVADVCLTYVRILGGERDMTGRGVGRRGRPDPRGGSRWPAGHAVFDQFDERVLRCRPGVKWSAPGPDVLPASIADMDFPVAEPVLAALRRHLDTGDFGYPHWPDGASP